MKKWQMLNKMGLEKPEAKAAAFLIKHEGERMGMSRIADAAEVKVLEIPRIIEKLNKTVVILADADTGERFSTVRLLDTDPCFFDGAVCGYASCGALFPVKGGGENEHTEVEL